MSRERYFLLDALRGLTLISMIAYHAMFDLVELYGMPVGWFWSLPGYIWQQSICWTFILLSGFCWSLGKAPLKRGAMISLCGLVITAVTRLFMPSQAVYFGILTFTGAAMLALIPLEKTLQRIPPAAGTAVSALLFFLTRNINSGYWGFEALELGQVPEGWYQNGVMTFLGFPGEGFSSGDYFSFLPWIFLYLVGYFLYGIFMKREWIRRKLRSRSRILEGIGRHTLPIYMLHQPVLLAVMQCVFRVVDF
ncbi:MAG: DUF1624 domain-containing protein [Clostridiales bacterium]|nr:DUF1624 domain-containing protein [Clostridiales bacterium]